VHHGLKQMHVEGPGDAPPGQRGGYYASEFLGSGIPAWAPKPNNENSPPVCTVSGQTYFVNGIAADQKGNLIVPGSDPSGYTSTIQVYQGPPVCPGGEQGPLLGTITDPYGQAVDAAAFNAGVGPIAVSEINYDTGKGDVVICTLASGTCSPPATSSAVKLWGAGVAMDSAGDCWLSTATRFSLGHPEGFQLIYWAGCTGNGVVSTGTQNKTYGGLFIDDDGNLAALDAFNSMLYVYSGCKPSCTLVGSMQLIGNSFFGNLNGAGTRLAVGDVTSGSVDVYVYTPTALTYRYSFNNGLTSSDNVEAGIFSPSNQRTHYKK
jgi:hypothetical protein